MTIKSEKMLALALMYLGGASKRKMAKQLHMSPQRVQIHMESELFKAQVAELRERVSNDHVAAVLKRIDEEGLASLQTLVEIRDKSLDDAPKITKNRMDAAKFLLGDLWRDRNMPKATPEQGGIRLSISEKVLHEMFAVLQEFKNGPKPVKIQTEGLKQIPHAAELAESIRDAEAELVSD